MIGLVLVFVACLSAAPDRCQERELPFEGSLIACMLLGQQAVAEWVGRNPDWVVPRGWRCEAGRAV